MTDDLARRPPKNARRSAFDKWANDKAENPAKWLKEWLEAKEWAKKELAIKKPSV